MNGYVDLQLNGYSGGDFNDETITDAQLKAVCERLAIDGVDAVLATIITATPAQMLARIRRVVKFCETHPTESKVIAGLHIEGPFISNEKGYFGAHPLAKVLPADLELAKRMIDAGGGHVRMMTLAPELDVGLRLTSYLSGKGILVSGGHANPTLIELSRAIDAGLSMWTHLGNGSPGLLPRHDNVIQRVLSFAEHLTITFIADGHHVPSFALRNYMNLAPLDRVVVVSDAMLAAGLGPGKFRFADQTVEIDANGAAWCEDKTHLAGSAVTLPQVEVVLRNQLRASDTQVTAWMRDNAKRLLSMQRLSQKGNRN